MARADRSDTRLDAPKGLRSGRLAARRARAPRPLRPLHRGDRPRMGTPGFLLGLTLFVVVWMRLEHARARARCRSTRRRSASPLLTLILSLQASYAAPLILLAQNRQDDRDRVQIEQDRQRAERNLADTEYLAREVVALRLAMQGHGDEGLHPRRAARAARGARRATTTSADEPSDGAATIDAVTADAVRARRSARVHRPRDPPPDHRARHGAATVSVDDGVAPRRHRADDRRLPGRRRASSATCARPRHPSPASPDVDLDDRRDDAGRARGAHRAAARRPRARAMPFGPDSLTRVIAVTSGKGGVGKSTVTANLAVALAARGLRGRARRRRRATASRSRASSASSTRRRRAAAHPVDDMILPPVAHGVKVISIGMFVDDAVGGRRLARADAAPHRCSSSSPTSTSATSTCCCSTCRPAPATSRSRSASCCRTPRCSS